VTFFDKLLRAKATIEAAHVGTTDVVRVMCSNPNCAGEPRTIVGRRPRREHACSHRCARKVATLLSRREPPAVRLGVRANRLAKMRDPQKLARRDARRRAAEERAIERLRVSGELERIWAQRQAVA
jgi:hypothetical protein